MTIDGPEGSVLDQLRTVDYREQFEWALAYESTDHPQGHHRVYKLSEEFGVSVIENTDDAQVLAIHSPESMPGTIEAVSVAWLVGPHPITGQPFVVSHRLEDEPDAYSAAVFAPEDRGLLAWWMDSIRALTLQPIPVELLPAFHTQRQKASGIQTHFVA